MSLAPTTNGFNSGKMPRRRGSDMRGQKWDRVLDELLRLFARGQDEGLPFAEPAQKRSSVRSAIETALVARGEDEKYGVECIADPDDEGKYWVALTTRHTVPTSRRISLKRTKQSPGKLPLASSGEVGPTLRDVVEEVVARLEAKKRIA